MKYLIPLIVIVFCSITSSCQNTEDQFSNSEDAIFDEMTLQDLATIKTLIGDNPSYELYPTDNIWTFLKLETSTGKIWQVQFTVGDGDAFQTVLNAASLVYDGIETNGRFKLHPTQNMYNFLLLDTHTGDVWQAQWSQNPQNRGIIPILQY